MKIPEFTLIDQYFKNKTPTRKEVLLGIGDDAALVTVPAHQHLVLAMDTLVEGVHFPLQTTPFDIGYKALAVNLSDLAAMGATPAFFMLALTLPKAETDWLEPFSAGLFELAKMHNIQLIGGDTTRGPLTITVQIQGFAPAGKALKRTGAKPKDSIYVTGTLGDAGLGLLVATEKMTMINSKAQEFVLQRLNRPEPRVDIGLMLRPFANSAIDISDGLMADLSHLLKPHSLGADLESDALPLSWAMNNTIPLDMAKKLALTAGDDYELCFTVSPEKEDLMLDALNKAQHTVTRIGTVSELAGVRVNGYDVSDDFLGYQHF